MNKYDKILKVLKKNLNQLKIKSNGFYKAASATPLYDEHCWLRDVFYESLPDLYFNKEGYKQTWKTMLKYLKYLEKEYGKFSEMIKNPTLETHKYLHARCTPDLKEIHTGWRDKQNDICGEILTGIYLGHKHEVDILETKEDIDIIILLVDYMQSIKFWETPDSGIWEENEEVRFSSIAICRSGLHNLLQLKDFWVLYYKYYKDKDTFRFKHKIYDMRTKAASALLKLKLNETNTRKNDLAFGCLIYPFNGINKTNCYNNILKLKRKNGYIRYLNDQYNNKNGEAQWTMGLLFEGFYWSKQQNKMKAENCLDIVLKDSKSKKYQIPEAYYANNSCCPIPINKNLGWSISLAILLILEIERKFIL